MGTEAIIQVTDEQQAAYYDELHSEVKTFRTALQKERLDAEQPHKDALIEIRDTLGPQIAALRDRESKLRNAVNAFRGRQRPQLPVQPMFQSTTPTNGHHPSSWFAQVKEVLKRWL